MHTCPASPHPNRREHLFDDEKHGTDAPENDGSPRHDGVVQHGHAVQVVRGRLGFANAFARDEHEGGGHEQHDGDAGQVAGPRGDRLAKHTHSDSDSHQRACAHRH